MKKEWDVFLCHAVEDKDEIARPLATELRKSRLRVWCDDFSLTPGHSLRRSIDYGLSRSRFGVVVLSRHFFDKKWARDELDALAAKGTSVIPVWHEVTPAYVRKRSPLLAGQKHIESSLGWKKVAEEIRSAVTPSPRGGKTDCILCIGSAVSENVRRAEHEVRLGEKNFTTRHELLGGSGYSYTCRLLAMGHPAIPILTVGKDSIGEEIQSSLTTLLMNLPDGKGRRIAEFVQDERFFCQDLRNLESTIIVSNAGRTILTEEPVNANLFTQFVRQRLDTLEREFDDLNVRAVMIGHIYADNRKFNPKGQGATTRMLIRRFKDALVFANFGESQYDLGWSFWKNRLHNVRLFQLSMSEARRFFCAGDSRRSSPPPLREIIRQFDRQKICAIITLDKYGAIATRPDRPDHIYIAWPHAIPKLVDPTGAGDAFGAGLVASFYTGSHDFEQALQVARSWAAYACTTVGGANECPSPEELKEFQEMLDKWRKKNDFHDFQVEIIGIESADRLLHVLDKAY